MSTTPPPPLGETAPQRPTTLERVTALPRRYAALPRAQRELVIYGAAFLVGLVPVPLAIWFAGSRVLGPYTHGQNTHAGPFWLLLDFLVGLIHRSAVFWAVALGPAVLLLVIRLFVWLYRAVTPVGDS